MSKNKKNNNSRRDFLKTAAIGAGGLSAAGSGLAFTGALKENATDPKETPVLTCDAAVVGGGVSGTYAALRLASLQSAPTNPGTGVNSIGKPQNPRKGSVMDKYLKGKKGGKLKVLMFEYSGRIGGRLLSTPIPKIPNDVNKSGPLQYAEFGGFRFDRQMKIVWETAEALKLTDQTFYYQDIKIEENNIVNVRGDIYTNNNMDSVPGNGAPITSDASASYPNLRSNEISILAGEFDLGNYVTNLAFEGVLPNANNKTDVSKYKNITKIVEQYAFNKKTHVRYLQTLVTFKTALNPSLGKTVTIPGGVNGWSFSYIRYHYAFNAGDWDTVKAVSDEYENAKKKAKVGGRPFFNWSWWGLKRFYLSQEATAYLEDTSGYNEQGTAGTIETVIDENYYFSVKSDSSPLSYYTDNDGRSVKTAWRHIREGYSAIPNNIFKIYTKLTKNTSGDVIKNQLVAFTKPDSQSKYSSYRYRCLFLKRKPGPANAVTGSQALNSYLDAIKTLANPNKIKPVEEAKEAARKVLAQYKIVYCNFLVLAMPRRALEMIDQNNFFFGSTGVQSVLMNSVHNIPAMRMFVAYPKAWWIGHPPYTQGNPKPIEGDYYPVGRTRTDIGLRQLYYWCYNKKPGSPAKGAFADPDAPAVMLASYTSGVATLYWRSFQNGQPYDLITGSQTTQAHYLNQAAGSPPPGNQENKYIRNPQAGGPRHGSLAMGIEAHKQIVELHGRSADYDKIPLPYYVHFEDWTKDPWGAGWHSWQSSYPKVNYIPLIRNPLPDENIFIIGECYSNVQGWVQGALNSAESMLQCNLGLKWAPWLSINGIWLGQGTKWVTTAEGADPDPCLPLEDFPRVINVQNY